MDWLKITNEAGKTAIIDIDGPIGGGFWEDGKTSQELKQELKDIAGIKAEKIIVNIDSLGGLVNHALSMHDLLKANSAEIETRMFGMTASAATIIAQAADKGKRKMSENALVLIHNAKGFVMGDKTDMNGAGNDLETIDSKIAQIYAKASGRKESEISEWMNASNGMGEWWDSDEVKTNGLVDETFEPETLQAVAQIGSDILSKHKLPSIPENKIDFINLNIKKMDLKEQFDNLKTWIKDAIDSAKDNSDSKDVRILDEKEVQDKIKALGDSIQEIKTENSDLESKYTDMGIENTKLKEEKEALEDDLSKLKAGKTDPGAGTDPDPEGNTEGKDQGAFGNFLKLRTAKRIG